MIIDNHLSVPVDSRRQQRVYKVIDSSGFRANVGIILCNRAGEVFWARRRGQKAWQFPQGGIRNDETPEQALYRELYEETGLSPEHVTVTGQTSDWLHYRIPQHLRRHHSRPLCIGQKQKWFSLVLIGDDNAVNLERSDSPEFDCWRWVDYWTPLSEIVDFKRKVYQQALQELEPFVKNV